MPKSATPRVRRSLTELQKDYEKGDRRALESLMRAWRGIKRLPPDDPNSFYMIGGFHGEPFRGKGEFDLNWWGGYCQHGTVLFPSWHRMYLCRLEQALQGIPGCADVMLPFWDECSEDSRKYGIPSSLTDETFELDGETIANPLRSFVLPRAFIDQVKGDTPIYSKPAGYETVRFPLSGLVGTPDNQAATELHNAQYPDYARNVGLLNDNITTWLSGRVRIAGAWHGEVCSSFVQCLDAPSYTVFSNTTSARAWNKAHGTQLVPLESPHNYMHLAVGGFDYPGIFNASPIPGANGDMGENDTAGLDPIFFFHHCFIDYVFWIWQRRHGATDALEIDPADPGANSNANPPPAGMEPNIPLTLETPLEPFARSGGTGKIATTDCINIEAQLGYTYGPGSLDQYARAVVKGLAAKSVETHGERTLRVSGINRAQIRGSFLISAFRWVDGKREYIGTDAVLSRWHVAGCMNCQNHLEASTSFRLPDVATGTPVGVEVEVRTRHGLLGGKPVGPRTAAMATAGESMPFAVEIL